MYVCMYVYIYIYIILVNYLYILVNYLYIYIGSKPNSCNKAGARTRDIPRYKSYVTGRRLSRQPPPTPLALLVLVIFSRPTSRDKGYVTSCAFHTLVT